jgi:predicted nucleotidyltransferase
LEKLKELVNKLINYKVRLIILFGSRARGDYTDESDIDVLIVADKMPSDPREAYEIVRRLIDVKIAHYALRPILSQRRWRARAYL